MSRQCLPSVRPGRTVIGSPLFYTRSVVLVWGNLIRDIEISGTGLGEPDNRYRDQWYWSGGT